MSCIDVMVVDDDRLALDYLLNLIDWEAHGFRVVATAFSGNQGYARYLTALPQVVITDVRMPHGDGIDLVKKIRAKSPEVKILLLTAYCDFDVAKKAIELGITEYIVKDEINEDSIVDKLLRIKGAIQKDRDIADVLHARALTDAFNAEVVSGGAYITDLNTLIETRRHAIIIERDTPFLPLVKVNAPEDHPPALHALRGLLGGLHLGVGVRAVMIDKERVVLLVRGDVGSSRRTVTDTLTRVACTVRDAITADSSETYTLFLVPESKSIIEIRELYREKRRCMAMKVFLGCGGVYNLCDMERVEGEGEVLFDEEAVDRRLADGDHEGVLEYLREVYREIETLNDHDGLIRVTRGYLDLLARRTKGLSCITRRRDLTDRIRLGRRCRDLAEITRWCAETAGAFCDALSEESGTRYSPAVKGAIRYINHHYRTKTLSVTEVSRSIGLSASRLSVLFKEETRETINRYITYTRIEQAKRLLAEGELRINEIAEEVGYGSSQYFSHVFQGLLGVTPRAYRKGLG